MKNQDFKQKTSPKQPLIIASRLHDASQTLTLEVIPQTLCQALGMRLQEELGERRPWVKKRWALDGLLWENFEPIFSWVIERFMGLP